MRNLLASDGAFNELELHLLSRLAQLIIPASDTAPGASDGPIIALALQRLAAHAPVVQQGLAALQAAARQTLDKDFLGLDQEQQLQLCESSMQAEFRAVFEKLVVMSYYEDERSMRAVGLPPRPAFPEGYVVAETDWSLTDPVRARGPIYRTVQPEP